MIVPNKLDCAAGSLELSSATGDFGDNRIPKLLVMRAKADFPALPLDESSWEPENGWEIFKFLAQEDMPVGDSLDGASRAELSCPEATKAEAWPSSSLEGGVIDGTFTGGGLDTSASGTGSILLKKAYAEVANPIIKCPWSHSVFLVDAANMDMKLVRI